MLEREAQRNLEAIWLLRRLTPDFKTIADFRKDNRSGIQRVSRQFTLFCRQQRLFQGDLVAIDGSKFKAVNSRGRSFTKKQLRRSIEKLDQDIECYLDELDAADQEEPQEKKLTAEELRQKIEDMQRQRAKAKQLEQKLKKRRQSQISLTDPDSRCMPAAGGRTTDVGYNVQVAVDPKHKLILDHLVTNAVTERSLLSTMAKRAKDLLGVDHLEALADRGYYHSKEIKACLDAGITTYLPRPRTSASRKRGRFSKEDFRYDPKQDCYWCPAGEQLAFRFRTTEQRRQIKYYTTPACRSCCLRLQCTDNKRGRRITRWLHEDLLDEMETRVRGSPEKMKLRKRLAEHPFGTIKRAWNQGFFLTRGLESVSAEMSLTVLAYNLTRAIREMGVPKMVEALA